MINGSFTLSGVKTKFVAAVMCAAWDKE